MAHGKVRQLMASVCLHCTLCKEARRKQRGIAFSVVRAVEQKVCPFCRAYEQVYGRKAHEPLPQELAGGQ